MYISNVKFLEGKTKNKNNHINSHNSLQWKLLLSYVHVHTINVNTHKMSIYVIRHARLYSRAYLYLL